MKDTARISVKAKDDTTKYEWRDVKILHRPSQAKNIIVHKTQMPVGYNRFSGYSVSAEGCGLAFCQHVSRLDGAIAFADYLASVPAFADIMTPADARSVSQELLIEMRGKLDEINKRFP